MMNTKDECRRISELLVDYADGDLDPLAAVEVGTHLEACPRCTSCNACKQH